LQSNVQVLKNQVTTPNKTKQKNNYTHSKIIPVKEICKGHLYKHSTAPFKSPHKTGQGKEGELNHCHSQDVLVSSFAFRNINKRRWVCFEDFIYFHLTERERARSTTRGSTRRRGRSRLPASR